MKHPKKLPSDVNQRAAAIVDLSVGESDPAVESLSGYLAKIGRNGGLKGGPARAKKLSAKRRSEIASAGGNAKREKRKND